MKNKKYAELLGKSISEIRHRRGMTQIQLAEAANTSQDMIWRYESGKGNMTVEMLGRIASALHVDIRDIVK